MHSFKDDANNSWKINLSVGEVIRIRDSSEGRYNLFDPESKIGERTLREVVNVERLEDWEEVYKLLWHIVEPQAESLANPLTPKEFMAALSDERLLEAAAELRKEWRDFFRRVQRPEIATALDAQIRFQAMAVRKLKEALSQQQLEEIDARVEARMNTMLSESSSNLRAELASILGPTVGDSSGT